jgi:predicted Ser/Thr protein kinase
MSADSETGPGSVGPYRLVQRLGEGGMGVVHLGLDAEGHAVAVKVLRAHVAADPDARRRLAREVATLRRVRHPRVAEVIDADVEGEVPYLVTRFVPGRPLDAHVRESGPLARGHVAHVGTVLADALRAIHDAGVVHRDVKPANVMLLDGEPVLIDFGIAHVADETRITMTGLVMGTPGYLSPEVVAGQPVTSATDWWGWGATLAYAATGRSPFGSGPLEVVLDRVRRGDCDLSGLGGPLRDALAAALTVDPARRPPPDDLVRGLTGPLAQRPPGVVADANGAATTRLPAPGDDVTTVVPPPGEAGTSRLGGSVGGNPALPPPNEEQTARVPPPWPQPSRPAARGGGQAGANGAAAGAAGAAAGAAGAAAAGAAPGAAAAAAAAAAGAPPMPPPLPPPGLPPTRRFDPPKGRAGRPSPPPPGPPGQLSPYPPPAPGRAGRPAPPGQPPYGAPPASTQVRDRPPPPPGVAGQPRPPAHPPPDQARRPNRGEPDGARPPGAEPNRGDPPPDPSAGVVTTYSRGVVLGVVVALAAMATVAPWGTMWIAAFGMAVARVVDRSATALLLRRRLHGPRGSDAMVTLMALPWRATTAIAATLLAMVLPVLVGISTAFIAGTAQAGRAGAPVPAEPGPLALGMLALLLSAWWGPGGGSVRRGTRISAAAVARGPRSRIAVWAGLGLLFLAALLTLNSGAGPDFGPAEGSRLVTQLRSVGPG